jgi:hypothetical membrane protein
MARRDWRLLFGALAALLLGAGVYALALAIPRYSHIQQTVSEIGEVGSPVQTAFTALICAVAASTLTFAFALRGLARREGISTLPAYFVAAMAISAAGVGIFSHPHPLHNVFGISELIGYQAPLVLALAWRRAPGAGAIVGFSWLAFVLVTVAIVLNLSSIVGDSPVRARVQRALFFAWFGWLAGISAMLFARASRQTAIAPSGS